MEVKIREPMKRHTSFRAGGPADWYAAPETADELAAVCRACRKAGSRFYVIGNGSNLLVSDEGFRGVIISTEKFRKLEAAGRNLKAGAGVLLSKAANEALRAGLSGLEFAAGIPGSVGGAVVMNAGAYGSEMKDVLKSVTVLNSDGNVITLDAKELALGYRTSIIQKKGYVVLEALFSLECGNMEAIRQKMDKLAEKRKEKQPLEYPSAGSTFKRPQGNFAGKLIMEAGLAGFRMGGAQVSEKHCGFVINTGNATSADIRGLIRQVQQKVLEHSGVALEMEVKCIGEFE